MSRSVSRARRRLPQDRRRDRRRGGSSSRSASARPVARACGRAATTRAGGRAAPRCPGRASSAARSRVGAQRFGRSRSTRAPRVGVDDSGGSVGRASPPRRHPRRHRWHARHRARPTPVVVAPCVATRRTRLAAAALLGSASRRAGTRARGQRTPRHRPATRVGHRPHRGMSRRVARRCDPVVAAHITSRPTAAAHRRTNSSLRRSSRAACVLFNRMRPYETTLPRQHKHPSGASQK
jgi:hypothetical protein